MAVIHGVFQVLVKVNLSLKFPLFIEKITSSEISGVMLKRLNISLYCNNTKNGRLVAILDFYTRELLCLLKMDEFNHSK